MASPIGSLPALWWPVKLHQRKKYENDMRLAQERSLARLLHARKTAM